MDELDRDLERAETQASDRLVQHLTNSTGSSSFTDSLDRTITNHPTHISRWHSQVIQHIHTVGSNSNSRSLQAVATQPLPKFGGGKPYPPEIPAERAAYVVDFESPDDPLHPINWKLSAKIYVSVIGALACFCSTFASAVLSAATGAIAAHFQVSFEVAALSSALYLVGYGVGPSFWGPMSELKGRFLPLAIGSFGFSVFAVATAVSKDIQTLMISRFFMGMFGSAPLVVVAAVYADIYKAEQRTYALIIFCCSVFLGPMFGPIVGSFTVTSYLGWRWDAYWSAIMGFTTFALIVLFLKETYPPAVLISKAELLRRRTKNWAIHAKQEEIEIDLREIFEKNISRPLRMLREEITLLLIGIYLSFVYGLMYIALAAFPAVYRGRHHWGPRIGSLPFIGMALGMCLAGVASASLVPRWNRMYHAHQNRFEPEWRLPLAAVGGVVFAIGLFWFGWTGYYPDVHWIVPTIGGVFIGFGLLSIFMQLIIYIVDTYLMFAASALAGNTIIRSLFAAACPLFDRQMLSDMHVNWAMTLLGALSVVLIPVPVIFFIYGKNIRSKSKWAPRLPPLPPAESKLKKGESVNTSPASDATLKEKESEAENA